MESSWSATAAAAAWAKTVRMAADTISWVPSGLGPGRPHKVHPASLPGGPSITFSIEDRSPSWASEMTRRTPARPRARRERRRRSKTPCPRCRPRPGQYLTVAIGGDPGCHDDGFGHHPGPVVGLDVGGVHEDIGELDVIEASLPELGDGTVELVAQMRLTWLLDTPAPMPRAATRSST